MKPRLLALTLAAIAPSMLAQSDPSLIGLTATTPFLLSQDPAACATRTCTPMFRAIAVPCAGGTAYDTRTRGTWITNGVEIARIDSRAACRPQCATVPIAPYISPRSFATGLAYDHGRNALYITDTSNVLNTVRIGACALTAVATCTVTVPAGFTLTGAAHDDVNDLLYLCASDCTSGNGQGGVVIIARASVPCTPICTLTIRACQTTVLAPLHGIAYSACDGTFWVTDGFIQAAFRVDLASCRAQNTQCCRNPLTGDPFIGLCIEPGTEADLGRPCSNPVCASCTPAHFLGGGDPVLGNLALSLEGAGLPAASTAAFLINFGSCTAPGFLVPPFCGPILVPLTPTLLAFSLPAGGTTGCTGAASLTVSLPPALPLCGLDVSTQILGICLPPTGGVGTYVSNCLSWTVRSS